MSTLNEEHEGQFLKVNRYEVEENAVFISYEHEQLLSRIKNFPTLKFQERLSFSKNIFTVLENLKEGNQIYELIDLMSKDHEQIQREILQQFQGALEMNGETLKTKILDYRNFFISPLINLIKGTHLQIKQQACTLAVTLLSHHKDTPFYQQESARILQLAVTLAHAQNEEDKIVSIQLLGKILPSLEQQSIQKAFNEEYKRIYEESTVRVKKEVITHCHIIAKYCSKQFFESKILNEFYIKSSKESAWGIRKACVEVLSPLIQMCENENLKQELVSILLHFLKDGNKLVRICAHKAIPQVIAHYGSPKVPLKLTEHYIKLHNNEINQIVSRPHEIVIQIAFFFPGVLLTIGKEKWPELKKLFDKLIKYKDEDVKMPIACGLHEIAKIIGPQASKESIFPALDLILKDNSDKLKLNAIAHLSDFVRLFDKVTQQNLIDVFLVLQKDPKKWRIRHSISSQLCALSQIYEPEINFKYIIPIALKLCNDNVNQVRWEAAHQIFDLVRNLSQESGLQQMTLQFIKGFGLSEKYIQRQTFTKMMVNLYKHKDCLSQENVIQLLQLSAKLAQDKVILVRISLAVSMVSILTKYPDKAAQLKEIISNLIENEEVADYFEDLVPLLKSIGITLKGGSEQISVNQKQKEQPRKEQSIKIEKLPEKQVLMTQVKEEQEPAQKQQNQQPATQIEVQAENKEEGKVIKKQQSSTSSVGSQQEKPVESSTQNEQHEPELNA